MSKSIGKIELQGKHTDFGQGFEKYNNCLHVTHDDEDVGDIKPYIAAGNT